MRRIFSKVVKLIFLLTIFFGFVLVAKPAHAQGDFQVNYTVDYKITDQGVTNVSQVISLVNLKTNLYAREYSIIIDSTKIKNIKASDRLGTIIPTVSSRNNKTEIRLVFNDEVVGMGNILRFNINYEDENITKKNGSIWEINIPGIAEDEELGDYTVKLTVPPSFGPAAYMVPEPEKSYVWGKKSLINGGVSIAFGSEQVFDLTLSYYLENTKITPIITEIALPPNTAYQFVTIHSLEPKPETITTDEDGNWLARYKLDGKSSFIVRANLTTQLYLYPRKAHTHPLPTQKFLDPTTHWQTQDKEIQKLATKYTSPKEIYDYVVKTLTYDYTRINESSKRKGAVEALKSPESSVCMEFTDLFVAIARAAGIPARQVVGYAFTSNPKLRPLSLVSDVLHAWPEYYDAEKQVWVPVDPTWGNTTGGINYFDKLDFNHIVFAYNGVDDEYPYPAGFYRQAGRIGKDVEVSFRKSPLNPSQASLTTQFDFPTRVISGLTTKGVAYIRNTGNVASEDTTIVVESNDFGIVRKEQKTDVPPFGVVAVPFTVSTSLFLIAGKRTILASVNGVEQQFVVDVVPAYYALIPLVILITWFLGLYFIIKYKHAHEKNRK